MRTRSISYMKTWIVGCLIFLVRLLRHRVLVLLLFPVVKRAINLLLDFGEITAHVGDVTLEIASAARFGIHVLLWYFSVAAACNETMQAFNTTSHGKHSPMYTQNSYTGKLRRIFYGKDVFECILKPKATE